MTIKYLLFVLLGSALLAAGCGPGTPSTSAVGQPVAGGDSPADAIAKAFVALGRVKSFRMRVTDTGAGLPTVVAGSLNQPDTTLIEVVLPDRTRIVSGARDDPTSRVEVITISSTNYFKQPGEGWVKSDEDSATLLPIFQQLAANPKKRDEFIKSMNNARLIGPVTLDGTPTLIYEFCYQYGDGQARGEAKLWVATSDDLPRRLETSTTLTFEGDTRTHQLISVYYDYNADIKIEPPIR